MLFFVFIVVSVSGPACACPPLQETNKKIEICGAGLGQIHCSCTPVMSRYHVKHTTTNYHKTSSGCDRSLLQPVHESPSDKRDCGIKRTYFSGERLVSPRLTLTITLSLVGMLYVGALSASGIKTQDACLGGDVGVQKQTNAVDEKMGLPFGDKKRSGG